jgi:putative (di)nucleoside polyphosphate hydrolase
MPQGGIDPYENPRITCARELYEETGIKSARLVVSIDRWLDYDFPTKVKDRMSGPWLR